MEKLISRQEEVLNELKNLYAIVGGESYGGQAET